MNPWILAGLAYGLLGVQWALVMPWRSGRAVFRLRWRMAPVKMACLTLLAVALWPLVAWRAWEEVRVMRREGLLR